MGKWLEKLKQKLIHAPSGAGSKGSKVNENHSNLLQVRDTRESRDPEKSEDVSTYEGSKGAKGGYEPFEPLPTRPLTDYCGRTSSQAVGPSSSLDTGQNISPAEWAVLERWLKKLTPADLPPEPFALDDVMTVVDKAQYLDALKRDAEAGSHGPRVRSGALQCECRKLRALLDAKSLTDQFAGRESTGASPREGAACI